MSIDEIIAQMSKMRTENQKRAHLQKIIGPKSYDVRVMHFRAMLMTMLNRAEIWPHRA